MNAEPVQPDQEGLLAPGAAEALDRAAEATRDAAQRLEHLAADGVDRAVTVSRDPKAKSLLVSFDAMLTSVGSEISTLAIIALALVILCAPIGLGLAAIYFAAREAAELTGHSAAGWIAGILIFLFLCRYVWGSKLQRASRRAALALISAMAG